jgi:hypothetical protein
MANQYNQITTGCDRKFYLHSPSKTRAGSREPGEKILNRAAIDIVGARHPQTFGSSDILSVPCPYQRADFCNTVLSLTRHTARRLEAWG